MPRAHGRIIDGAGNGVPGTCYFYKALDHEPTDWRAMIDTTGRPVTVGILGRPTKYVGAKADAVPGPDRRGFFDVPGGLPSGTYWIEFHAGGNHDQIRWAWPFVVTDGTVPMDVRIGGPSTGVPGGQPDPTLARQFTPGTFTASCSLYGLLGAPLDRAKRDLSRFRAAGFGNARVWVDWGTIPKYPSPGSWLFEVNSVKGADGKLSHPLIPSQVEKLQATLDFGASIGMTLDLTMQAKFYEAVKRSAEGYDISAHKTAVRELLTRWGNHPGFRILDLANEAEVRGPGNHGSPDTGHVSPGRFAELMQVARSIPRTTRVGISISGAGQRGDVTLNYQDMYRDTRGEILLPHWPRKVGCGATEGSNSKALKARFGGEVHNQEPFRRGYNVGYDHGAWPLKEFEDLFRSTKREGCVGACFHTEVGFDMRERDAWDQLDEVERQVVANLKGWIA